MMTPHEDLRAWRTEAGKTVTACAAEVGVTHPTWLDWEAGKKRPRIEHAIEIEKITAGRVSMRAWVDPVSPRLAPDEPVDPKADTVPPASGEPALAFAADKAAS